LLSPDDADLLTPAFVEGEELPVDAVGEVAEDGFGGWVDVERWSDEVEARWLRREVDAAEVAVALELAEALLVSGLEVVMANADPIVEALQG